MVAGCDLASQKFRVRTLTGRCRFKKLSQHRIVKGIYPQTWGLKRRLRSKVKLKIHFSVWVPCTESCQVLSISWINSYLLSLLASARFKRHKRTAGWWGLSRSTWPDSRIPPTNCIQVKVFTDQWDECILICPCWKSSDRSISVKFLEPKD